MDEGISASHCFTFGDPLIKGSKVALLLLADTANSAFDMWWVYDILVNHFSELHDSVLGRH